MPWERSWPRVGHKLRFRPVRFLRVFRVGQIQDRVHKSYIFDRFKDRIAWRCEAIFVFPLEVADPNDDLGELLRIQVNFNPS